ncbi:hypothetical protein BH11BAC2_BH11BAC2_10410 [soil metagenome]
MKNLIVQYLEWKGTYAHRASIAYRIWLFRFIEICGEKPIESYTVSDIVKYRAWLEKHYGSYSIQFAMIVIKNFFQFCITQGNKCLPPTLIRLPRVHAKSHRAITEKEYKLMIANSSTNTFTEIRDTLLIRMLWDTGVRVSELGDLDISQIDEAKCSTVIATKKTGKKRIIMWSKSTHEILVKYISLRTQLEHIQKASALFLGWEFGKGWSSRLCSRSIQRIIKQNAHHAGIIEKVTPHSFRHGWAHIRRDQNASLAFIQKGLGHSNPISTFVYQQYNDKEFENTAMSYLQ